MERIRTARVADAPGIARVHLTSWRETYAHLLSAAFLDDQDPVEREAMWRRALARDPGRVHVAWSFT
ncbi:MAG: hypothetical protein ACOYXW_00215 [Actinomycetota bacterium]